MSINYLYFLNIEIIESVWCCYCGSDVDLHVNGRKDRQNPRAGISLNISSGNMTCRRSLEVQHCIEPKPTLHLWVSGVCAAGTEDAKKENLLLCKLKIICITRVKLICNTLHKLSIATTQMTSRKNKLEVNHALSQHGILTLTSYMQSNTGSFLSVLNLRDWPLPIDCIACLTHPWVLFVWLKL